MKRNYIWLFTSLILITTLVLSSCAPAQQTPASVTEAPPVEPTEAATEAPTEEAPQSPAEPVTLEFWGGWTGPDGDVMQTIVDKWNAENPKITVNLTRQAWSPQFDAFLVASSAKQAPDIMALRTHEEAQFIAQGLLTPLDDIVANSDVLNPSNYLPTFVEFNTYEGHQYGIPLDVHMHGLYYNLDLFEKAGIEKPPVTALEVLEAARLLTLDASGKHPGDDGFDAANAVQYGINQHTNHHAYFQFQSLLQEQGSQIISDDGKTCAIDIDKGADALNWQKNLVYTYGVAPQGQTDYIGDFLAGRTAMLIDGPWQMPALEKAQAESGFNWASAPYPAIFTDQPAVWGSSHAFTLPTYADPEKQVWAVKFLEWLAANSAAWIDSGQLPVYNSVMNSSEFQDRYGRAAFISMMPNVKTLPSTPKFNEIFATNAPTPMMVMAQSVVLEQADPKAAVEKACGEINSILAIP